MPRVSVILPTFNRASTLPRAVRSVLEQSFEDLELIVIDDGSSDGSADRLPMDDRRLVLLRQNNLGVAAARNAGIKKARGELISFIYSDDEWMPYQLELACGFFAAFPGEDLFHTEILVRRENGAASIFPRDEFAFWYPRFARRIGSKLLDLPAGEQDVFMRVYGSRCGLEWLKGEIAHKIQPDRPQLYRGAVYPHLRWGYLAGLQALVITKRAGHTAGGFNTRLRSAEDFAYMATLFRAFPLNFLSVTGCIKHEESPE